MGAKSRQAINELHAAYKQLAAAVKGLEDKYQLIDGRRNWCKKRRMVLEQYVEKIGQKNGNLDSLSKTNETVAAQLRAIEDADTQLIEAQKACLAFFKSGEEAEGKIRAANQKLEALAVKKINIKNTPAKGVQKLVNRMKIKSLGELMKEMTYINGTHKKIVEALKFIDRTKFQEVGF